MIVAIAPFAASGRTKVEEFREAASAAAAVSAFCAEYSPPLTEADYIGFDIGQSTVPDAPAGDWYYDHDTPGLVGCPLADYRNLVMQSVDAETARRFAGGFTYASKQFSLSLVAQLNLNGLKHNKARLVFPYSIATIDNLDSYDIADAADADALYDAAFDFKAALIKGGNTVKQNVRDAADEAAVDTAAASWLSGGQP